MPVHIQFEPKKALRAVLDLVENPDDLPKVFAILDALSGTTLMRIHARMARDASGARLLRERSDVVPFLRDRAALKRLPEGSLGRAYLAFVEAEGISAEGIREANDAGYHDDGLPAPLDYVHERMRDTHDLWHAIMGYRGDVAGELGLLGFTFAQTKNAGIALIIGAGVLKTWVVTRRNGEPEKGAGVRALVRDGMRRGREAAWLPAVRWEDLLARPVDEVRAELGVGPPVAYTPIRSAELREATAAGPAAA